MKKEIIPFALVAIAIVFSINLIGAHAQTKTPREQVAQTSVSETSDDSDYLCGLDSVVCDYEKPKQTITASVTKYSRRDSCHNRRGDVCLTAIGEDTKAAITVACPRAFRLGTKVRIGGHEYICEDRTAKWVEEKFGGTFDIFTENQTEAINFGRQKLAVEIL